MGTEHQGDKDKGCHQLQRVKTRIFSYKSNAIPKT